MTWSKSYYKWNKYYRVTSNLTVLSVLTIQMSKEKIAVWLCKTNRVGYIIYVSYIYIRNYVASSKMLMKFINRSRVYCNYTYIIYNSFDWRYHPRQEKNIATQVLTTFNNYIAITVYIYVCLVATAIQHLTDTTVSYQNFLAMNR